MTATIQTPIHPNGDSIVGKANPQLVDAMAPLGLDQRQYLELPGTTVEELEPVIAAAHEGLDALYSMPEFAIKPLDDSPEIVRTREKIKTYDGSDLMLYHFRRADLAAKTLPAVVYYHGGGMVIATTLAPVHIDWCLTLASQGVHVVLVDYHNAWTSTKHYPFPTGQLDCAAALKYVFTHKQRLGIDKIVVQGESGGGNLAITTALRAKREGYLDHIDGVFACIPYISNGSQWSRERQTQELPSFVENDGFMLSQGALQAMGIYYGPGDLENPHAWPYYATVDDVKGLPPHMIVVDELDMFRDEGIVYHRKLVEAGVQSTGRVNLGTTHGASFIFRSALPHMWDADARAVAGFAKSL